MGFFSKVFKGVKKVFKKVGKGIKSAFKSIGKFMDKIGIVGQIGLSLLLPGVGEILGGMLQGIGSSVVNTLTGYTGVGSSIVNGAGNFLAKAGQLAGQVGKSFSSITEGVKNVVGETLKAGANALGLDTAVLKAGETFGSEYLMDLGESIRAADLTSIGEQFGTSVENVVNSFGNIGKDLGGVSSTSSKLTDGAVTPQPEISYDPDIVTPDMPAAAQVKTDSLLAPNVNIASPAVGDPSVIGNRKLLDPNYISAGTTDFAAEAAQRAKTLQDLGVTSEMQAEAAKEGFIDKTLRLGREKLQELPQEAVNKLGSTLTDMPSQFARRAVGLDPDPVYNQVSYATVVPTIQEAPMVSTSMGIDPVQYVANNQQSMGLQPFGFNANMYNEATYMNQMRKYGFV